MLARQNAVRQARNEKPQAAYPTRIQFTHADQMETLLATTIHDIDQCPAWFVIASERSSFIDRDELKP